MDNRGIEKKIAALSEELVLLEPSDPQGLAALHTGFEEIGQWAEDASQPKVATAVAAATKLIEDIVLEEAADPEAAIDTVGRILSALQAVVCEGRDEDEVDFPPEVQLAAGQSEGVTDSGSGVKPSFSLPAHVDETIFADFLARQRSVLQEMEALALEIEKTQDEKTLDALRRIIHTLKGESALLGLADIEQLCHATEDAMSEHDPASLVDVLLDVKDWWGRAFDFYSGRAAAPTGIDAIFARLLSPETQNQDDESAGPSEEPVEQGEESAPVAAPTALEGDPELLGDFVSEAMEHLEASDVNLLTLETAAEDEEALNAVFRAFHTIKGVAGFLALHQIGALAHEAENLLDRARKGDLTLAGTAIDVTFDAVDTLKRLVDDIRSSLETGDPLPVDPSLSSLLTRIKSASSGEPAAEPLVPPADSQKRVGEILIDRGATTRESVDVALQEQVADPEHHKIGEQLVRDGEASAKDVAHALRSQKAGGGRHAVHVKETVKVDADRLDQLVDAIGEMVIAESMVSQSPEIVSVASQHLTRQLSQLDKITRELQEMATSLRMVPVRATFQRMARLVRDLAKKSGKRVEFVMTGEDTELDKTVVDQIGDPLVHMIRNAVDHGIEDSSAERERAGKPAVGRVELCAFHKGGNIHIEIEDDGRGLDRDVIYAKGVERGVIREGDTLSDRETFNLIFEAGFSTAKKVTEVSGRGVGMDVVRRNIETLRGKTDIRSTLGEGSVFSIQLPLTLAIIDGMVVRVGHERYIIPTLSIVMSLRPKSTDIETVLNRAEMLKLQGNLLPLFRLGGLFTTSDAELDATQALVVVVEADGNKAGLVVDELLGQQQIVIKSLGESMRGIPGVSGGAIMPDGRVGLVLDVGGLVKLAHTEDRCDATSEIRTNADTERQPEAAEPEEGE